MLKQDEMVKEFQSAFAPPQATLLARAITEAHTDLVKTSDFNELKAIMAELAEAQRDLVTAQRHTDQRMGQLAEAQQATGQRMGQLAEAQARTEQGMAEFGRAQTALAEAQARTEQAVQTLALGLRDTRAEVGGRWRPARTTGGNAVGGTHRRRLCRAHRSPRGLAS